MSSNENDTRTVLSLTTGSKICLLVAIPLLVGAAYFLFAPISIAGSEGRFGCQSAINPPSDAFPKNVCGSVNELYQLRAGALLVAGLLVAGVGILSFGVNRRTEERPGREDVDDTADDDDLDD